MGQVFDLAGHGSFEYEQRGFETAVGGILKSVWHNGEKSVFCLGFQ